MHLEEPDAGRRRRGPALEAALLDATWAELVEVGYGALTLDSVAQRAGTSRPVIARRWATKPELVHAAVARVLAHDRTEAPDTGSLRGDVLALMRRTNETRIASSALLVSYLGGYFIETGTNIADLRRDVFGDRRSGVDDIVDRAVARGEIPSADVPARIRTLAFDLFRHEALMRLGKVPDEVLVEIVDEIYLPLITRRDAPA
ncbi:TetR/AcrR family transcriptional regulator [Cellulomonas sp. HZM]|uniref:TetR/AcrR family transcriptional regulator n=1 Tax=Cellulomonas sp. HZM TaxID=1454010 RepID=UPI000492EF13|nr:TetR/AcrR family transcriptional regulator [Cellulomonas sp. HZM]